MAKNKLLAKLKKDKALVDLLRTEQVKPEWISTNCISVNLLLSGKIQGGIKKGSISMIAAESSWGKSMIGYAVLKAAQAAGMDCFIIDTENSVNYQVLEGLGIDMTEVGVFGPDNRIPQIKKALARMSDGLSKAEARNVFLLFDSWGPIVENQVLDKAKEASDAVNMSAAKFKNELANILLSCGFTTLVMNHVYDSMSQYDDPFKIPGGKRIIFNSDAIMCGESVKKDRDKDKNILGKIITASVKKGRGAKEFVKTKYLIQHQGGINPYYGLLDEAEECGVVVRQSRPSLKFYRPDYDVDKETGEITKWWKETELYCPAFWIPLYKDEKFRHYVETKFAFEDQVMITTSQDVMAMMNSDIEDYSAYSVPTMPDDGEEDNPDADISDVSPDDDEE